MCVYVLLEELQCGLPVSTFLTASPIWVNEIKEVSVRSLYSIRSGIYLRGQKHLEGASGSHVVHASCSADDVLEDMPYADAIIKEVMRLHGIVDGVWRQALEDITVQGYSIPKVRAAPDQCTGFLPHVLQTQGSHARQCSLHPSPTASSTCCPPAWLHGLLTWTQVLSRCLHSSNGEAQKAFYGKM